MGGYAGGSLGYGDLDGSDAASLIEGALGGFLGEGAEEFVDETYDLEDGSIAYGLHAGYSVRRGAVVFGPELSIFGGGADVGGRSDFNDGDPDEVVDASVSYGARLALRGGATLGRTLVYGTLGAAYLNLDVTTSGILLDGSMDERSDVGYAVGFGVERLVTDRVSVGAQYSLHQFDDFDLGNDQEADVAFRTLDLRLSFHF